MIISLERAVPLVFAIAVYFGAILGVDPELQIRGILRIIQRNFFLISQRKHMRSHSICFMKNMANYP